MPLNLPPDSVIRHRKVILLHTHFASGTSFVMTGLNVLLFLTFWKLAWFHLSRTGNPTIKALSGAAFFQAG